MIKSILRKNPKTSKWEIYFLCHCLKELFRYFKSWLHKGVLVNVSLVANLARTPVSKSMLLGHSLYLVEVNCEFYYIVLRLCFLNKIKIILLTLHNLLNLIPNLLLRSQPSPDISIKNPHPCTLIFCLRGHEKYKHSVFCTEYSVAYAQFWCLVFLGVECVGITFLES